MARQRIKKSLKNFLLCKNYLENVGIQIDFKCNEPVDFDTFQLIFSEIELHACVYYQHHVYYSQP